MTCITCGCRARTMSSGWSLSLLMTCARSHSTTHHRLALARHRFTSRHGGCTLCTCTYTYTSPGSRQPARSLRQAARAGDCQSAGTSRGCGFKAVCGRGPEGAAGLPCAAMRVIYQANAARPRKRNTPTRQHASTCTRRGTCHAHIIATRTCSSSCRCILLISASPPLPPPAAAGTRLLPHEACTKTCDSSPVWGSRTCNKRGLGFQYITRGR